MKKLQRIIAIGLICLTLGSMFSMAGCKKNEPKYNCSTCQGEGIIDCPNCHVKECNYRGKLSDSGVDIWCEGGKIAQDCDNCEEGYIGYKICSNCRGDGYDSSGYKCRQCSSGYKKVDCPACEGGWMYLYYGFADCALCDEYEINGYSRFLSGGEPCMQCKIPTSNSINNGYSYIDCPDCE